MNLGGGLVEVKLHNIAEEIEEGEDISFIAAAQILDAIEHLAKHPKPVARIIRIAEREGRNATYEDDHMIH